MKSITNNPKLSFGALLSKSLDSIINSEGVVDREDQFQAQIEYLVLVFLCLSEIQKLRQNLFHFYLKMMSSLRTM